jgi:predicted metal-dependent peptidase
MAAPDAESKLAIARTRLVMAKPFLGALVLRLPLVAAKAPWCRTTATDARRLYYDPDYIAALTLEETQFVLAHEALHCALSHFARRGHRVKRRWDLACDFAINPLLLQDGLKPPPGTLLLDVFAGMSAEEIYPCLEDDSRDTPLDDHLYDGDEGGADAGGADETAGAPPRQGSCDGQPPESGAEEGGAANAPARPPPLGAAERDALAAKWARHLAGAAQQARLAGKLSGALARLVDDLLAPSLSWRALLAQFLSQTARDDYSYQRPSRREGTMILPSLKSAEVDVVVALDTSGSISAAEMAGFLAEINALKGQLRARVTLLACDAQLACDAPWRFEPWQEFTLPRRFEGGGGTNFSPVFDWVERQGEPPGALVYFTDAEGEFPPHAPSYPVLWLVKGNAPVPWGRRIALN